MHVTVPFAFLSNLFVRVCYHSFRAIADLTCPMSIKEEMTDRLGIIHPLLLLQASFPSAGWFYLPLSPLPTSYRCFSFAQVNIRLCMVLLYRSFIIYICIVYILAIKHENMIAWKTSASAHLCMLRPWPVICCETVILRLMSGWGGQSS